MNSVVTGCFCLVCMVLVLVLKAEPREFWNLRRLAPASSCFSIPSRSDHVTISFAWTSPFTRYLQHVYSVYSISTNCTILMGNKRWQATVAHSTDSWTDSCRLQPWHNHGRPKAHPCVVPPIVDPVLDKEHKLYSPKRKVAMHHERTMILLSLLLVRDWNLILLHCKAATKH
jgi:hypothetical protein